MIGYYVHHVGRGHLHRATAVARATGTTVAGLSTLSRPEDWTGPWVQLPPDDDVVDPIDVDAGGVLHWVPELDPGVRERTAEIARWIHAADPALLVTDVSVEVALLARLHGVPVVTLVLPGDRTDPAHGLVHRLARRVVGVWPDGFGSPVATASPTRVEALGAVSRFDGRQRIDDPDACSEVLVLNGAGGGDLTAHLPPELDVRVIGPGRWVKDPWPLLCGTDVVVTHAGQHALAEVAAARVPAVVVPQPRPHDEQAATARFLVEGPWPVGVDAAPAAARWPEVIARAASLDGARWATWNDGRGASRLAALIEQEHDAALRRAS